MNRNLFLIFLLILTACSTGPNKGSYNNNTSEMKQKKYSYTNHLINETSPYLLEHAHNPVDWYAWGKEAFEKAKKENKLVLVSIGYAACHWCHVMAHESFENKEIADIMNKYFVCIKVDREERPDVDHQYMDAVQLLTGSGGWPLNCFALPDGRPVWGGTYFPRKQWKLVLTQLAELYKKDPQKLIRQAEQISKGIKQNNLIVIEKKDVVFQQDALKRAVVQQEKFFDKKWGGNLGAPKFPMPSNLRFLLNQYYHTGNESLLEHVKLSLQKMAMGGIYDPLGGGFSRYSTDSQWKVPHFEKMLYNNAQLIQLYSEAYQITQNKNYKSVVYQTVDFMRRELLSPQGGFFSSIDADSEGEEGAFYVWTKKEIDKVLGNDASLFEAYYSITENGNWEKGKNVLFAQKNLEAVATSFGMDKSIAGQKLEASREKLFQKRSFRPRPLTDTKVLTSWNALAVSGLLSAYAAFDQPRFLSLARQIALFLRDNRMMPDGKLYRAKHDKNSFVPAFMDDYALTIQAFIKLYRYTFEKQWLLLAQKISRYAVKHFYDKKNQMFSYSDNSTLPVINSKTEITDNVIPASNSVMAFALYELSVYFDESGYKQISRQMLKNIYPRLQQNVLYFSNWALLLNRFLYPSNEVVFCGKNALIFNREFSKHYFPVIVAGSQLSSDLPLLKNRYVKGKTLIYVCENNSCKLPVYTVKKAIGLLRRQ